MLILFTLCSLKNLCCFVWCCLLKMVVANSFDLWLKDSFFSAAEEVQESADIMESAYRVWSRKRIERSASSGLNELCRELQTALGTAKWQLEEFEKEVRLSYRHHGDDNAAARHRQFISAIKRQISQVEEALRESFTEEGKQPLRWVNLNEKERDDLAAFLSRGTCQVKQSSKDDCEEITPSFKKINPLLKSSVPEKLVNIKDTDVNVACNQDISTKKITPSFKDTDRVIETKADSASRNSNEVVPQMDSTSTRKTWSHPNYSSLKIVIADKDEQRNKPTKILDATLKEKGSRPFFWKQKCKEYPQATRAVCMFNERFGRFVLPNKQFQIHLQLRYRCSIRITLALMWTIFLIGFYMVFMNRTEEVGQVY
ncbi:hypothetical protein Lal_00040506 [Lupinus albus]|uniref:Putative PPM-type phosphatase domain-containing protein n=1 Tax=Lupinus albus TaxID=3870 RepID=A0A6A4PJN9_LUPAL|nr:putative PPM-type phosphatase domain-containing protein [Lupinus albus]KAF1887452.1 hypothetical protein Lal_00040506 [Lupinus albus]